MLEIVSFTCLVGALILLFFLSKIDLEHGILPNELVFGFACSGIIFHILTAFIYLPTTDIVLGAVIGGGSLLFIRSIANWWYKTDTLGLGDVKLMGAAGIWLGPYYILIALTLGAVAGIVHGLGYAINIKRHSKTWPKMNSFSLPAGPGFAVGIVIAGLIMFWGLPMENFN